MNPRVYQALVLRKALEMYAKHGIKVNRAYTPTAMMATAEGILGTKLKSRDYLAAADALANWIEKESMKWPKN